MRGCVELRVVSSSLRFPLPLSLRVRARAVSACLQAYRATGKSRWRKEAWSAFNWFLGDNDLQVALYDRTTGGCRDGLHPDRANENQGAESTLSFLMALLEMRKLEEADVTESTSR